jgi:hypothetical protein
VQDLYIEIFRTLLREMKDLTSGINYIQGSFLEDSVLLR